MSDLRMSALLDTLETLKAENNFDHALQMTYDHVMNKWGRV